MNATRNAKPPVKCSVPGCGQPSPKDPEAISRCPAHLLKCVVCGVAPPVVVRNRSDHVVCAKHSWTDTSKLPAGSRA